MCIRDRLPESQTDTGADGATEVAETGKKNRSPWPCPLVTLAALLVLSGGGTAVALLSNSGDEKPAETTQTTTSKPTTAKKDYAEIDSAKFTGKNVDEVVGMLTEMGFTTVEKVPGNPTADDQVNLVSDVSPTGKKVKFTQKVSVTYNVCLLYTARCV